MSMYLEKRMQLIFRIYIMLMQDIKYPYRENQMDLVQHVLLNMLPHCNAGVPCFPYFLFSCMNFGFLNKAGRLS